MNSIFFILCEWAKFRFKRAAIQSMENLTPKRTTLHNYKTKTTTTLRCYKTTSAKKIRTQRVQNSDTIQNKAINCYLTIEPKMPQRQHFTLFWIVFAVAGTFYSTLNFPSNHFGNDLFGWNTTLSSTNFSLHPNNHLLPNIYLNYLIHII